jgi:hypothetical protein
MFTRGQSDESMGKFRVLSLPFETKVGLFISNCGSSIVVNLGE